MESYIAAPGNPASHCRLVQYTSVCHGMLPACCCSHYQEKNGGPHLGHTVEHGLCICVSLHCSLATLDYYGAMMQSSVAILSRSSCT